MARKPSRMPPSPKPAAPDPGWAFRARFRRNAFGWRSAPAVARIREAVAEIRKAARSDPRRGAEGAVLFLEGVAPAIEHVDGSSGSIGTAVHRAIEQLVPIIAAAPVDDATRARWLERLDAACEADRMPYLESLGDHWGKLCGGAALAGVWADRLLPGTRIALRWIGEGYGFEITWAEVRAARRVGGDLVQPGPTAYRKFLSSTMSLLMLPYRK